MPRSAALRSNAGQVYVPAMRVSRGLLIAVLVGCGPQWVPVKPASVPSSPESFNKAIGALVAEGESIDMKDEAAGTIVTRWIRVEQLGNPIQMRITVMVADDQLVVGSQCQRPTIAGPLTTTTSWEPCGDRHLETQQAKIDRIAARLR